MREKMEPRNNYDRLLTHLEDGSLAYRLVQAYRDRDITHPVGSMKAVLLERLEQVRGCIDNSEA
jgi:hypothetical protein